MCATPCQKKTHSGTGHGSYNIKKHPIIFSIFDKKVKKKVVAAAAVERAEEEKPAGGWLLLFRG
jgi:hypothetical protein